MAVGRYRALFAAFGIQAQDILLRSTNRGFYKGPHAQSYLAGFDDLVGGAVNTKDLRNSNRAGGRCRVAFLPGRDSTSPAERNENGAGERSINKRAE